MTHRRVLQVEPDQDGMRLDNFLTGAPARPVSRSQLQRLIKDGHVTGPVKHAAGPARRSAPDRPIRSTCRRPTAATPEPEALPLRIVFEDADVVVLDKPAGMVVHPGAGHSGGTLVNALLHHVKDLSGIGGELRPGIVHRLDRGTSGLMVVAKNDAAHQELARQFQDREVEKEYVALVWGVVQAGRRIDCADRTRSRRPAEDVDAGAARAQRGHAGYVGAPLQGRVAAQGGHRHRAHAPDPRPPQRDRPPDRRRPDSTAACTAACRTICAPSMRLERPFLHAARLAFTHPADGRRVEFDSPLPPDLESVVDDIAAAQEPRSDATEPSKAAAGKPPAGTSHVARQLDSWKPTMSEPERLSTERLLDGKSSTSIATACACPTAARSPSTSCGIHDPSCCFRCPNRGTSILIRQYRYAVNKLPVGAAGGQRRSPEKSPSGGAARVPRGDRPGSRHHRAAGGAGADARLLRRRDALLPRLRAVGAGRSRRG